MRRGSLRRGSLRRGSLIPTTTSQDIPWDILDRLLIPILCCHAAAIILSGILNLLRISDVSTLALFAWFALSTGGSILFYHHLKVNTFNEIDKQERIRTNERTREQQRQRAIFYERS